MTYEYLTSLTHRQLLTIEERCILCQDTDTLRKLANIKLWKANNKSSPAPNRATFTYLKPEVEDIKPARDVWGTAR